MGLTVKEQQITDNSTWADTAPAIWAPGGRRWRTRARPVTVWSKKRIHSFPFESSILKPQENPEWLEVDHQPGVKRTRFTTTLHPMEFESAKAKLAAAKQRYGREIRVFETPTASSTTSNITNNDEPDDFYEFTAEDYYRLMATKKEDKHLKTRKIREAEEAARRSRITKTVIRVRFPDNYTLEAVFHPSETIQSLVDLLMKVINHPEVPFYIYTTPPKKQLKDLSQDFYSAGFIPGAIVYFTYDLTKGDAAAPPSDPFLIEEVMCLQGLEIVDGQVEPPTQPNPESESAIPVTANASVPERKPVEKKNTKPKWLKM